jgi:biofilm PGA synthesis N-glycosyltransferase PgaC
MTLIEILAAIQHSWIYWLAILYFAAYPMVTSVMWITTSMFFRNRWEKRLAPSPLAHHPRVSVLIPAHNEERVIGLALAAATAIDYPDYEVVVVDDGSTDGTRDIVEPYVQRGLVRLIVKQQNEGKAMALNDALPCLNGEIVLIMDADAEPAPDILQHMLPHFEHARVAAVTGNPRVKNVDTFLARLQLIEFSSIVSLLRRSQRIWGRIMTVSGVVAAFRKSALLDVGGFSPEMPTEDIELTWKLQRRFWDIRYEPHALVWMTVPSTLSTLIHQRRRWSRGLMQVLHKHRDVMLHWRYRRMWPIFIESSMSILWSACFVVLTALWLVSYLAGYPPVGAHPIPNLWGMAIATLAMLQLLTGTLLDRRYDPGTLKYYPYAVYYPIVYWMLLAWTNFISLSWLFRRPSRQSIRWRTVRKDFAQANA